MFLSFRGEDTRNTFTDHLYHALLQRRVIVYRDNELKRGDNISQVVYKALEQSRISIVILSSNYANSKWCLDELSKIVECMNGMRQRVLPVFYDVEPSEVRKQTGTFGNAFAEHEQVFRDNREKVLRWRDALYQVANLSGFVIRNRCVFALFLVVLVNFFVLRTSSASSHPVENKSKFWLLKKFGINILGYICKFLDTHEFCFQFL